MCGVCGVVDFSKESINPKVLKSMTDAISHRGPDGEGFFTFENMGFGHRRLAIIDLSISGNQPMVSKNADFVIVYNGELFNYLELRTKLEKMGHTFNSNTDTEVALLAWKQWGTKSVEEFNGMFAFAILDVNQKNIYLVRDRYGIKPMYYGHFGNKFIFGSEQKAIFAHPSVTRSVDNLAIVEYLTFQNLFTDKTLIENIRILPPASILRININEANDTSLVQYWDFQFEQDSLILDQKEYEEELSRLLKQAVTRQLIADVPVGSYLSGGMDSGTITAIAAKKISDLKTFTVGFDLSSASGLELAFDERRNAESMSSLFKTEQYEMVLKSGDMEKSLESVVHAIEEPRVGQSYPNYYAAKLASKFVKVTLSGAGGDELFAGYPWRYFRSARAKSFIEYSDDYYDYWQRLIPDSLKSDIFSPIWNHVKSLSTREIFRDVFKNHKINLTNKKDYINHSLYFESKTFLHGLLIVEDKLSMSHSLESRVPFLDNDLVDFAMKVPIQLKLANLGKISKIDENQILKKMSPSVSMSHDGKLILRKVMSEFIPDHITKGKKQGFSAPDASWFQGESIAFIRKILVNPNAKIYNFLAFAPIVELIEMHFKGQKNLRLLIWSLIYLETYLNNEI